MTIRFYFSFRSPYAWLAAERLEAELGDLGAAIECLPVYPTPDAFPNDPTRVPAKAAYIVQDVARLVREQGLRVRFPPADDPDWALAHAAFLGVRGDANEPRFLLAVFRKRFGEGLDLGDEGVLADAAREAGVDPERVRAAAHDPALRAEAEAGFRRAVERDRIFGVPTFVFAGKLYWGQDRMRFVRNAVVRKTAG